MEHGTAGAGTRGSDWEEREERLLTLGQIICHQLIEFVDVLGPYVTLHVTYSYCWACDTHKRSQHVGVKKPVFWNNYYCDYFLFRPSYSKAFLSKAAVCIRSQIIFAFFVYVFEAHLFYAYIIKCATHINRKKESFLKENTELFCNSQNKSTHSKASKTSA